MSYSLNSAQESAVTAPITPHLIIAGAGTGKTTVLIERIIYLIKKCNIHPQRIWIVTFTNKAINEVRNRINKSSVEIPNFISTFHGACVWILRKDIEMLGRSKNFRIADHSEQTSILKKILKNINSLLPAKKVVPLISRIKTYDISNFNKDVYEKLFVKEQEYLSFRVLNKIYLSYTSYLEQENILDFDDLVDFANKLLNIKEVRNYWNNFFDAILIDEFQDINNSQFSFVQKILGKKENIFCVGDPDQSIYGFRGARPEICKEFLKLFPNAKVIKLEENYRSTQKILNVANTLINKNKTEFFKNLFTKNEPGEDIKYFVAKTEEDEVNWILNQLWYLMKNKNVLLSDCVILYRNHSHAINLEKELINRNIPYLIHGSIKFFERVEIKNIIAYLNLVFFNDSNSIERIINVPSRYIGKATLDKLITFSDIKKISLHYLLTNFGSFQEELEQNFAFNKLISIKQFSELLKKIKKLKKKKLSHLVLELFELSEYKKELESKRENSKIENVISFATSLNNLQSTSKKTCEELVQELSLNVSSNVEVDNKDSLNLSTVHNSKGLEFDYVFVMKMTETQFPYYFSPDKDKISEERRLAYVAFTRARKRLFLSASPVIDFHTGKKSFEESIFISEIKFLPEFIKIHKHWN